MSHADIELLLKKAMGLNSASVGSSTIGRAIQKRMSERKEPDVNAYYHDVMHSRDELNKLIEAVVIPETWFFRDGKPFQTLDRLLKEKYIQLARAGKKIRILSAPCSTGEEPYSIAMVMLNNGLNSNQFEINAIDISSENIRKAAVGIYSSNSFRGNDTGFKTIYFTESPEGYILSNRVRESVRFEKANLLDPTFTANREPYDIIFCRNLLIYFDRDTQKTALDSLSRILKDDGTLFVGHAEGGSLIGTWSPSKAFLGSFAFNKMDAHTKASQSVQTKKRPSASANTTHKVKPFASAKIAATSEKPFSAIVSGSTNELISNKGSDLSLAAKLANEGHMAEAAKICETHLHDKGPDTEAYFLLALIREATGNREQAAEYLKKVVYLSPRNYEAIVHLASLLQLTGDTEGAKSLMQRADRIQDRSNAG